MKRVDMRMDEDLIDLIHDYMDLKEVKTFTQAVRQLVILGAQSFSNKDLRQISSELRSIRDAINRTNDRISLLMKATAKD